MKILLYGGTFDPPHKGHLHLLESAMEYLQPDKVVIMPAGVPPHKKASATPSSIRLAMCRCFETLGKQVQLSDWEISRKGKNYTVDTIGHLRQCYPHGKIYLCIGGDMLTSFTAWKDWQRLLRWCTLVALCRDSGQMEPFEQAAEALRCKGAKIVVLPVSVVKQSSTDLRRQLIAGNSAKKLLPKQVAEVVEKYGVYQQKEGKV